ncbi:FAS1-like dehydratase domain-containing protein [Maritimibacter fusiformis]|uniref:MaoC family dehydratase n=1 Tax=Maritimibacter fusiformis TaxID=2603819 RepID=A0A5D0RL28_9RHOB|nr:MaoC family dehydratase N-terminal domain-containing protein [Maritimibacter fusiformis]TYB82320.1 MaoC family dehydratase [Maritimibacter fusiformis]
MTLKLPEKLEDWIGFRFEHEAELVVERGAIMHWLEAVRDANPVYWDDAVAEDITGGIIAPAPMASTFATSYRWSPRRPEQVWDIHGVEPDAPRVWPRLPVEAHFSFKEFTGLKQGIVGSIEAEYYEPLRLGDRITVTSFISKCGELRTNRLGTGRDWTAQVEFRNQNGDMVSIDRFNFYCYNREAA